MRGLGMIDIVKSLGNRPDSGSCRSDSKVSTSPTVFRGGLSVHKVFQF